MSIKPWDMVNPNQPRVPKKVSDERYKICQSCEHFIKMTTQCRKCGCFMHLKTKLANAECPIKKWESYEEKENDYNIV